MAQIEIAATVFADADDTTAMTNAGQDLEGMAQTTLLDGMRKCNYLKTRELTAAGDPEDRCGMRLLLGKSLTNATFECVTCTDNPDTSDMPLAAARTLAQRVKTTEQTIPLSK